MPTMHRVDLPQRDYAIVAHQAADDPRLTFRSRGVLLHLLARSQGWETSASAIARNNQEGRDAVARCLKELEQHGYLTRSRKNTSKGWVHTWHLNDRPEPRDGFSGTGLVAENATSPGLGGQSILPRRDTKIDNPLPSVEGMPPEAVNEEAQQAVGSRGAVGNPVKDQAQAVTKWAWDAYKEKRGRAPAWSFVGIRKMVYEMLRDEAATARELAGALSTMTAVTRPMLGIELEKRRVEAGDGGKSVEERMREVYGDE